MAETNWIEISTIGSPYEQEMDATAFPTRYRHRRRGEAEWRPGLATDAKPKRTGEDR
jgi:hypothetical protein